MATQALTPTPGLFDCGPQEYGLGGPTCDPILAIHRGKDSYVTFHLLRDKAEDDGTVKKVMHSDGAVRVEHLANMFPQFRTELELDSYFSINGFYKHAGFKAQGALRRIGGLPHALRNFKTARYLNGLYCDVDCYKLGVEPGVVVGRMVVMQDRGIIPPISVIVRSGQGCWALWLLIDSRESTMPPTAHAHRQLLHERLERELIARLAEFGVDTGAYDIARITRVPGSINGKCGKPVEYLFQTSGDGKVHMHTMEDLAEFLHVPLVPKPPESRADMDDAKKARSVAAARRLALTNANRLQDFRLLWKLRGCFSKGSRNWAALIYAFLLRANRIDDDTIRDEVTRLGRECRPTLDSYRIRRDIASGRRYSRLSDAKIAKVLAVTDEEAEIIPRFASPVPAGVATVKVTAAERRRIILDIAAAASKRELSGPEIVRLLALRGIASNRMTVSRDRKVLFGSRRPASRHTPLLPLQDECYLSQG
jgi:hypothetical protein